MARRNGVAIMSEEPKAIIESCKGLTTLKICKGTLTIYPTAPTKATKAAQKPILLMSLFWVAIIVLLLYLIVFFGGRMDDTSFNIR